ncbi:MAG TPA: 3-oxoacyl-[acyl-carrier-protein] synthase III C-terminal domain-containing protein [Candidatus Obscuribacterales bacterium]
MKDSIGILGFGYSLPCHIRTNDDPLFHQIKATANSQGVSEKSLFTGTKERRYLKQGETVNELMVQAAQQAIAQAGLKSSDIDCLYGYASVSEFITPNALYKVHADLNLSSKTLVVPINSEFSNFVTSLIQAWSAIAAGHCENALVVCGCHWTKYVDYTKGHSLSIGDGAGAAVIGRSSSFSLIDYETETLSNEYGAMTMQCRTSIHNGIHSIIVSENNLPIPTYDITAEEGIQSFLSSGMFGPPTIVKTLLERHGLTGKDIALIGHQASRKLMDNWNQIIKPKEYFDTLEQFGNMVLASIPVTLAYYSKEITADYIVLVALGIGFHQTAFLIKR